MAALDDALAESSVVLGPHQLRAYWRETDRADDANENEDSVTLLTPQFNGSMTVSHALDDALPDPVTVTGSGDPSGILTAGLNGREGLVLASSGFRPWDGGGGSWDSGAAVTTITAPIPYDSIRDDFRLSVVLVDDSTANLIQTFDDPKDAYDFHGEIIDGTLKMQVYSKRRNKSHHPQLTVVSDKPVDFMSISMGFWAQNPTGMVLDYRVTDVTLLGAASAVTSHSVTSKLSGRGYQIGFWGSATVGAWAPAGGSGLTLFGDPALNDLVIMAANSDLRESGVYTLTATQSPANATVCMAGVSIEPYERPRMDARQYFSPFNTDSPIYGYDRDTAAVQADLRVVTAEGPVDTRVFTGQMQGIGTTRANEAEIPAVSKARIALNRSLTLPIINGPRENVTVDWLATYLMARGGSFAGPAPNKYTRYWAPLYGSTHAHWDGPESYNAAYYFSTANPMGRYGLRPPTVVPGPFVTAMYGQQSDTRLEEISLAPRNMHLMTRDDFPHLWDNGEPGPLMMDMMSLANSKGRLMFWVRGDAHTNAPSYISGGDNFLVKMMWICRLPASLGSAAYGWVEAGISSNTRNPYLLMGTDATGYLSTSFIFGGLPTDGDWHFVGFNWDFANGTASCTLDGSVINANGWFTGGYISTANHPPTDEAGRARGDATFLTMRSHLPISDVLIDFGQAYVTGQWAEHYPTPAAPGNNAVMRATNQPLAAIAEPTAVNAWDTLAALARSSLSAYRCDENDAINFLPLSWFGETEQMTPAVVHDTQHNAGELFPVLDSSKIRNLVTLQFPDTRVDTNYQPVLHYLTGLTIPIGASTVTFPLDVPTTELHGMADMNVTTAWRFYNLTSSQITTPTLPKNQHYITANTSADGTGTVLNDAQVKASIVSWDAGSITIRFVNSTGAVAYLANNGDQVPFMQVLGYGARSSDAYTSVRDESSILVRRERALDAEMSWIHTRAVAQEIAGAMVNILSRPRPELTVVVMGDPRRKPGQLVTIVDEEGTRVNGNWRVWSVDHTVNGPQYTQELKVTPVGSVLVWDDASTGWDISVWGE